MDDALNYSYQLEIRWKSGNSSNLTTSDRSAIDSTIYKLRRDPEVLELIVYTYETRRSLIKEETFNGPGSQ